MLESIIAVGAIYLLWVIVIVSYELAYELAIVPLKDVKRKFLMNMSKRKFDKKIKDSDFDDETTIEEDNMLMQRIESIVYKFQFKYMIIGLVLLIFTFFVALKSRHLDFSSIAVFLIAGCSVAFLIAKHKASKEQNNEKLFNKIRGYLKLDDRYTMLIKKYLKEEDIKSTKEEENK